MFVTPNQLGAACENLYHPAIVASRFGCGCQSRVVPSLAVQFGEVVGGECLSYIDSVSVMCQQFPGLMAYIGFAFGWPRSELVPVFWPERADHGQRLFPCE